MKILSILISVITLLLIFCMLVCGLWVRTHPMGPGGSGFHFTLGIVTLLFSFVTAVLLIIRAVRG